MSQPDLKGKLDQVNEQIAAKTTEAQTKWAKFEATRDEFAKAGNEANRTDSDEFKAAEQVHKEYAAVAAELKGLESVRDGVFQMVAQTGAPAGPAAPLGRKDVRDLTREPLSKRVVDGDGYKGLVDSGRLNSQNQSFNAKLGEIGLEEFKTLITGVSDTSGGAFIDPQRDPYVEQPKRTPRLFDLITVGTTGTDAIQYARQTTFTNVAAETAEATVVATGTKPEATIAFEIVNETVKTIAHYVPATRRALADAGQLRTIIDSQLRYGLEYRLESQIIAGGGTGEDLKGLVNQSNILTQAKSTDSVTDALHKAITQIRLGYLEPNGTALHPNDWQSIRLLRDDSGTVAGTGQYLFGPPSVAVQPTVWGLPVAVTTAVAENTGWVADFRYATLWLREAAQILATDSHDDWFIKNIVAVLAEMRCAFGVTLPQAFCKVTGI